MDAPTHLHDDVKGKVEQQVANGDGQKVGGEVVGSLYEAVGRSTEREREDDVIIQSCTVHFLIRIVSTLVQDETDCLLTETSWLCSPLQAEPFGPVKHTEEERLFTNM